MAGRLLGSRYGIRLSRWGTYEVLDSGKCDKMLGIERSSGGGVLERSSGSGRICCSMAVGCGI